MSANPSRRTTIANTMRVFQSHATNDTDLAIEDTGDGVGRLPASVEFQTVGNYGLELADGTQLTYNNVVAGKQLPIAVRTLLAEDDATNPSDADVDLVCIYN